MPRPKKKKSVCENAPDLLYRVAKAMAMVKDGRELLKIIVEYAKPVFYFYDIGLSVLDKNGDFFLDWAVYYENLDPSEANLSQLSQGKFKFPVDEPLLRYAIERVERDKRPFIENLDAAFIERFADFPHLEIEIEFGYKQYLVTTLQAGGKVLGVLNFNSQRENHFDECDFELFQAIADLVAAAVANVQANEEILGQTREKEVFLKIAEQAAKVRDFGELFALMMGVIQPLLKFDDFVITTLSKDKLSHRVIISQSEVESDARVNHPMMIDNMHRNLIIADDPWITGERLWERAAPFYQTVTKMLKKYPGYFWAKMMRETGLAATIAVTLRHRGETIGGLYIHYNRELENAERLFPVVEAAANQIATVIANLLANEEIVEREKEKEAMLAVSRNLATIRNKNDLFRVIAEELKPIFDFDEVSTVLYNGDLTATRHIKGRNFIVSETDEIHNQLLEKPTSLENSPYLEILKWNQPRINTCADVAALYPDFAGVKVLRDYGFQEFVSMPLRYAGKLLGVFEMHCLTRGKFSRRRIPLYAQLADQIAVAVSNILANEEILEQTREKTALLDISEAISKVRNRDELLQTIIAKVQPLYDFNQYTNICVYDRRTDKLEMFFTEMSPFEQTQSAIQTFIKPFPVEGIFRKIAQTGEVVIMDEEWLNSPESSEVDEKAKQIWRDLNLNYNLSAALRSFDQLIGTFHVHFFEPRTFTPAQLRLFKAIADQIAVAVSNILGNEEIQTQFAEIKSLKKRLEAENVYLAEEVRKNYNFEEIIGTSPNLHHVFEVIEQVAPTDATVLIQGETGTGKELIARAIHNRSSRSNRPLIKINCATLPKDLIESELFGHERGAFTGATEKRVGKFELANQGTIFLDEIGELPLEMQVKLLRVLQEREIERVGGKGVINLDLRIVAATNRNLAQEVQAGRFRADLYYRLCTVEVFMPPLRERREDIEPLTMYFARKYAAKFSREITRISSQMLAELDAYDFPGNIRELEHIVEHAVIFSRDEKLILPRPLVSANADLPITDKDSAEEIKNEPSSATDFSTLEAIEREHIISVLRRINGKIKGANGAAEILGLNPATVYFRMKKLQISKNFL